MINVLSYIKKSRILQNRISDAKYFCEFQEQFPEVFWLAFNHYLLFWSFVIALSTPNLTINIRFICQRVTEEIQDGLQHSTIRILVLMRDSLHSGKGSNLSRLSYSMIIWLFIEYSIFSFRNKINQARNI